MKELSINLLKLLFIWTIAVFLVASCGRSAYASSVHQKADELALVGYNNEGVQSAYRTFLCVISLCICMLWRGWRGTPSGVLVSFVTSRPTLSGPATLIWS